MKLLWRIVIVLTFSLLGMQGAFACEHHHHDVSSGVVPVHAEAAHCLASTSDRDSSCHRTHSLCCMSACGVHCGALLSSVSVSAHAAASEIHFADSDAMRASVTRAPPVRPPIA
ncbi:hypothetical protein ACFQ3P_17510 [Paraburkholderia sabiae]|uniref:Uncharacterized protein n=1 Tax=Paraburkholderia sabiae TaxID=273251 RepID=A0ABU9QNW0_9BURK|nr:hypothetical protein [Paraburkholderia sabiae]WJZ74797.1 hypothetical protein QEN71_02985 [Paraburkholderia sabiae]